MTRETKDFIILGVAGLALVTFWVLLVYFVHSLFA